MERKEAQFYMKLLSSYDQVVMYEDPQLQDLYLSHIPVMELQTRAEEIRGGKLDANEEMSSQDCLVLALLKWFKCKLMFIGLDLVIGFSDRIRNRMGLGLVLGSRLRLGLRFRLWLGSRLRLWLKWKSSPFCASVLLITM